MADITLDQLVAPKVDKIDLDTQIWADVEDSGQFTLYEVMRGTSRERTHMIHGRRVEHIREDEHGRWVYRSME